MLEERSPVPNDKAGRPVDVPSASHVLVIEDHPLFCEALTMTLTDCLKVENISSAESLADALKHIETHGSPDIVVLDLNLPDVAGMDGLIRLKAASPGTPVIVVSSIKDNRIVAAVLKNGGSGFISKDSPREQISDAVRMVWDGGIYTPEGYVESAGSDAPAEDQLLISRLAELTPQQGRILHAICEGKLNKQIAFELSIAEATVKAHVTAILRKLGVHSRTQAVLVAQKARFSSILHEEPLDR